MKFFSIKVHENSDVYMEVFLRENPLSYYKDKRPCVLIFPGDSCVTCSDRDSEETAMKFIQEGFQAIVLRNESLKNAAAAITMIREHAKEWSIDPEKIAVFGVSEGGHLAVSLAVFYQDMVRLPGTDPKMTHPNALLLSCPVIAGEDQYVTEETCPTFIWANQSNQTFDELENSVSFAKALRAHNVPFDLHFYSNGTHMSTWVKLEIEWLKLHGFNTENSKEVEK